MVGFDPKEAKRLSPFDHSVAGAASGIFTRGICQPVDVVKIRFQLQVEPIRSGISKYSGIFQAFSCIVKEEGVTALWKGHVPAQLLSVVFGVVQFTAFEGLTRHVWDLYPERLSTDFKIVTHFMCGGLAGSFATIAAQPFDVIRTRFVAQGNTKIYDSMLDASVKILKGEGFAAFYKGLVPTLLQITPQTGLQFGFYSLFSELWVQIGGDSKFKKGGTKSLLCGAAAGMCAKSIIFPLDLVKKRLQIQGFEKGREHLGQSRHYTGMLNCIKCIVKEEGIVGLYKGLSPSLLKAMLAVALHFWSYEQCCKLLRDIRYKDS